MTDNTTNTPTKIVTLPNAGKKRSVRILKILFIASLLIAIAWGIYFYFRLDTDLYTNDAEVEQYINPINVRIPGYIKEVRFTDHQQVKKGDTLVLLDNSEYLIEVEQAEGFWLSALAGRKVASSTVTTVNSNISTDDANIKAMEVRVWNAEQNLKRFANLLKDEATTQQQYDQVKTDYESLQAQLTALQQQKQTTRLQTAETAQKVDVSDADIKRTHAALELAKLNLSYTVITAPYDGVTGRRNIQEGQFVQADNLLLDFVRNDSKWIVANYLETQVTHLRPGDNMSIRIDGIRGKTFSGHVASISEATGSKYAGIPVDNAAGNFIKVQQRVPVRILLDATPADSTTLQLLRAGMNAQVWKAKQR